MNLELLANTAFGILVAVGVFFIRRRTTHRPMHENRQIFKSVKRFFVDDNLGGIDSGENIAKPVRSVRFAHDKIAGGNVRARYSVLIPRAVNAAYKVVRLFVYLIVFGNRTGRDNADYVAFDGVSAVGFCKLLANGNFIPRGNKFCYIRVCRMVRHATHRRALIKTAVPPRKR